MSIAWNDLDACRGCRHRVLRSVLEFEPMPLAGQFCSSLVEAQSAVRYPLTWLRCERCNLVQVREDVDDRGLFTSYNYASSTVPGLVRHFEAYAVQLATRHGTDRLRFLEIGCNDGVLLSRLPATWDRIGVDPSDVASRGITEGYRLVNQPFSRALAADLVSDGQVDVISGSNCLAHISDLMDVFEGAHLLLREGGALYAEVHDLGATLADSQWDTVYHEHKVEWSVQSLRACVENCGFSLVDVQRLPLHGGLIRACFQKRSTSVAFATVEDPSIDGALETLRIAYEGRRETALYRYLADAAQGGKRLSSYGASGRANVWLNQLPELPFEYILDDSPLRNGRWLPCRSTPIVPSSHLRQEPTDICLITAWNYSAEIRAKHHDFEGEWLQTFGISDTARAREASA